MGFLASADVVRSVERVDILGTVKYNNFLNISFFFFFPLVVIYISHVFRMEKFQLHDTMFS